MWALLGSLGKMLIDARNKRVDASTQIQMEFMKNAGQASNNQAAIIQQAMSVKVFWVAWSLFAIPLGLWWLLVMFDTMTNPEFLNLGIPMLPPTIKPYADQIFNNLFYSGAGVGVAQASFRGILSYLATRHEKG